MQDTFVIAAAELTGLRDRHRLRPWLYAVARNGCLRRAGGAAAFAVPAPAVPVDALPVGGVAVDEVPGGGVAVGAGPVGEGPVAGVPGGAVAGGTGEGFGAAERAEVAALLRAAAWGLGAGERDLIQLRWQQGLDVVEIAAILGVSRNRAHALLTRAEDRLETALSALLVARTGVPGVLQARCSRMVTGS